MHNIPKWIATRTNNPQGTDYREIVIDGKLSELTFTVCPLSMYWRAGFKLFDPNGEVLPLRNRNSFLFHLGSTNSPDEYGFTAYLDGEHIAELNKTKKYPANKLLEFKVQINHNNFIKVWINGLLEYRSNWHFKNPNIREKIVLLAWGDENDYDVKFSMIEAGNWKQVSKKNSVLEKLENNVNSKTTLLVTGSHNTFFDSLVHGGVVVSGKDNHMTKTNIFTKGDKSERLPWHRNASIIAAIIGGVCVIIAALIGAPWLYQKAIGEVSTNPVSSSENINNPRPSILHSPLPSPVVSPVGRPQARTIETGKSYIDSVSGIVVGVNSVFLSVNTDLTVTFPGKSSEEFAGVKSGRRFDYLGKNGIKYALTITEISSYKVEIQIDQI